MMLLVEIRAHHFCNMFLSFWAVLYLLHWHLFDVEPCFPPACRPQSRTESESDWNQVCLPWPLETTENPPENTDDAGDDPMMHSASPSLRAPRVSHRRARPHQRWKKRLKAVRLVG